MEVFEESQLYYTTSFEKKQAGNAGNACKTQGIIDCIDYCRGKASEEASFSGALLILCFRPNRCSSTEKNARPEFKEKAVGISDSKGPAFRFF